MCTIWCALSLPSSLSLACVCVCVHVKRAPTSHSLYYFGRLEGTRETTVGKGEVTTKGGDDNDKSSATTDHLNHIYTTTHKLLQEVSYREHTSM